jgi:hypothetical protein
MTSKCPEEPPATEILPNLWLGNSQAAADLNFIRTNNIRKIINITSDVPSYFSNMKDINYLVFLADDKDICLNCKDFNTNFIRCNNFILDGLKSNTGVLVHCKRGHHRSASIIAAFIIDVLHIDRDVAIKFINRKRRCALVRETCMTEKLKIFCDE